MEEEAFLKYWFERQGGLISEAEWALGEPVSNHTAEHEVRYRLAGHQALKRTWPGTFGFVPAPLGGLWKPVPATPRQYLLRQALQNELFGDEIALEGAMISAGPSMLIGQPSGGLSLVISQPWLDALDASNPHPEEDAIAQHLRERGFEPLASSLFGWRTPDSTIILLDAKPDNFIATPEGILPIDLLLTEFPTGEKATVQLSSR